MKLPLSWAQSFAPFAATPKEFAERMTMTGSKVEYYECEADNLENVVIGRVAQIERHPDSDHLWVCQVTVGNGETVQIVTGAQNLKQGDLCPAALHGARLPGGVTIKKGKLRGVESAGMLCSLAELGLTLNDYPDATEDGILVLGEEHAPGTPAATALGMDETVFEFEITPNRPDCLSVRGLAREAAATFGVPFSGHTPPEPCGSGDIASLLSARIDTPTCLRYAAAMVENVRIAPSPLWLRQRLRHAGVRPINNIVDITNYVMLEYGQPMHAFDYAYVNGGSIAARMAMPGESIVTLDGTKRALSENIMVIADEKGPIAVAGVMGGEHSGVYESTQKVVFESAAFDGPCVRGASRALGLRTESSTRFEKGLDPNTALPALRRALELVAQLNAGDVVGGVIDVYPAPRAPRTLALDVGAVNRLLGVEIPRQDMADILLPLGFALNGDTLTIPTARADVAQSCDIAEEVARFVGYNKLPATLLRGQAAALPTPRQKFDRLCVNTLTACGLWQCQTVSFYGRGAFDKINLPADSPLRRAVTVQNPLGEDTSLMRTTALPSLMEVLSRNWAARAPACAVFEKATEYRPAEAPDTLPDEPQKLVLAAYGQSWDYAAIKGVLEQLLAAARLSEASWEVRRNPGNPSYHPGRCADVYARPAHDDPGEWVWLATLGEVHPAVLDNYDIKTRAVAAEVSLDTLFALRGGVPQYRHLPRFPAITRDLALVTPADMPAATVADAIRAGAGRRLEGLSLFDVYTGEKLGAGKKSLAYSLTLRDENATLTDADADALVKKVLGRLEGLGVVLRA